MAQTGLNRISDIELVQMARNGDGNAFTALWDEHIDALRTFLKGWLKNLDDLYIDDICSRSFEKAFRQIATFDGSRSHFITWLRTIARNTALDMLEQESRIHSQLVSIDDGTRRGSMVDTIPDEMESPLETIIRTESREETTERIEKLPALYREVARKRLLEGLQYKEIAQEMDMELNTVRTRIRRAKALMEKMTEEK